MATTATDPLTCIRCRYDLRGSPSDGLCPECGMAVASSAAVAAGASSPRYRWRVGNGAIALAVASGASIPAFLATVALTENGWVATGCWVGFCFELVRSAGVLALTSRATVDEPAGAVRRIARVVAVLVTVGWAGAFVVTSTGVGSDDGRSGPRVGRGPDPVTLGVGLPLWHASLYGTVAALAVARQVSRRLGRPRLAEHAALVAWTTAVAVPAFWVLTPVLGGNSLLAIIAVMVPVGTLVVAVAWAVVVFGRLGVVARRPYRGEPA